MIRHVLNERDRLEKRGDYKEADQLLEKYGNLLLALHANSDRYKRPEPSQRKRTRKPWLPSDPTWRERMFEAASGRNKAVVAALSATGARPSEIVSGVRVELDEAGIDLIFTIKGSKVDPDTKDDPRGQPVRRLVLNVFASPETMWLAQRARELGPHVIAYRSTPKALGSMIARLSRRLWRRAKRVVSPYSFRHQFAADQKRLGVDKEAIALSLGHAAESSQKAYGLTGQGRGRLGPIAATGARRVRSTTPQFGPRILPGGP